MKALFVCLLVLAVLWDGTWKVIAMWKSARNGQLGWYVCLAVFNTLGLLPILYILAFKKTCAQGAPRQT